MKLWAERCSNPKAVEYVIATERDDTATQHHFDNVLPELEVPWAHDGVVAIRGAFGGSSPSWNAAYRASAGSLLVQVSDDQSPPLHWDLALLNRLPENWENKPLVVAVGDSNRKDRLLTTLVATRRFCDEEGCFLFPGFKSVWSDGDVTYRAYRRNAVIEARDIVFEHKHPFFDKSLSLDETYKLQNEPVRYAKGEALFVTRHPEWKESGIVDWV